MDAGALTTLGGIVAMMLGLLAIIAHLRRGSEALEGRIMTEMAKLRSELKEDIQEIRSDLRLLNDRVSDLQAEVRGLRKDVDVLRVEVRGLRKDVDVLKVEMRELRKDVGVLQVETRGLKRDVVVLQVDMGIVKHHLGIAPDDRTEIVKVQAAAGS